jgi:hypothetical protein
VAKYKITSYTKQKANQLGVEVRLSTNPKKKIDVFKNGKKVASVGAIGYADYPTYIETKGETYAKERRRLYKIRHEKDRHKPKSDGYYADKLLW